MNAGRDLRRMSVRVHASWGPCMRASINFPKSTQVPPAAELSPQTACAHMYAAQLGDIKHSAHRLHCKRAACCGALSPVHPSSLDKPGGDTAGHAPCSQHLSCQHLHQLAAKRARAYEPAVECTGRPASPQQQRQR